MHNWKWFYGNVLMYVWACVSCVWLLLQSIKLYTSRNASGISLAAFVLVLLGQVIWFVYACCVLSERNYVIMLNSALSAVLTISIIVGVGIYG